MEKEKSIVLFEGNKAIRTCNLVYTKDGKVNRYLKVSFVGDNDALQYGIGNIWIEAYDRSYVDDKSKRSIDFSFDSSHFLYDAVCQFASELGGATIEKADLDYDTPFVMNSAIQKDGSVKISVTNNGGDDDMIARIKVDYQCVSSEVNNALINFYSNLEDAAFDMHQLGKVANI